VTDTDWRLLLDAPRHGLRLGPPSSSDELAGLESRLGHPLPDELRDFLLQVNGFYDLPGQWQCSWDTERIGIENEEMRRSGVLDRSRLAFGDNGAGDPFCVVVGHEGAGLVEEWSPIDGAATRAWTGLVEFWTDWLSEL
jgi:hypothetical protein